METEYWVDEKHCNEGGYTAKYGYGLRYPKGRPETDDPDTVLYGDDDVHHGVSDEKEHGEKRGNGIQFSQEEANFDDETGQ